MVHGMMRLIDLLVIYLAVGAPFAARRLVSVPGRLDLQMVAKSVAFGIAWPLLPLNRLASRLLAISSERLMQTPVTPELSTNVALGRLAAALDQLSCVFDHGIGNATSEFSQAVDGMRVGAD